MMKPIFLTLCFMLFSSHDVFQLVQAQCQPPPKGAISLEDAWVEQNGIKAFRIPLGQKLEDFTKDSAPSPAPADTPEGDMTGKERCSIATYYKNQGKAKYELAFRCRFNNVNHANCGIDMFMMRDTCGDGQGSYDNLTPAVTYYGEFWATHQDAEKTFVVAYGCLFGDKPTWSVLVTNKFNLKKSEKEIKDHVTKVLKLNWEDRADKSKDDLFFSGLKSVYCQATKDGFEDVNKDNVIT